MESMTYKLGCQIRARKSGLDNTSDFGPGSCYKLSIGVSHDEFNKATIIGVVLNVAALVLNFEPVAVLAGLGGGVNQKIVSA